MSPSRADTALATWANERVPPGVDYPHVLRTPRASVALSTTGLLLGLMTFLTIAPLAMRGLAWLYWLATGRQGDFEATLRALVAYELPFGLVVGHLGLATLIPLAMLLVVLLHRVRPGYLSSVVGRLRWPWLWACVAVAAGSLAVVLLAQNLLSPGGPSWAITPQPGWAVFVLVMLLTTPLQAAAEEYFFRGYLMQAFGAGVESPWFGIVTSAAVFTVFHLSTDPALVLDRFAFGILAGWLVWRTGGLEAAIAAHVVNNVAAFTLAALTSSMAQVKAIQEVTWAAAGWDIARFALFTALAWWLATRLQPERVTRGRPAGEKSPGLSRGGRVH